MFNKQAVCQTMEAQEEKTFAVRLSGDLLEHANELMETEELSTSQLMRNAIRHYVAYREHNAWLSLWEAVLTVSADRVDAEFLQEFSQWFFSRFESENQAVMILSTPEDIRLQVVKKALEMFRNEKNPADPDR